MWPFRRARNLAGGGATGGSTQAVAVGPPPAESWRALTPVQRVVEPIGLTASPAFDRDLVSWRDPVFLAPLGHHLSTTAPAGVVSGLAAPAPTQPTVVQRAPDVPLRLPDPAPPRGRSGTRSWHTTPQPSSPLTVATTPPAPELRLPTVDPAPPAATLHVARIEDPSGQRASSGIGEVSSPAILTETPVTEEVGAAPSSSPETGGESTALASAPIAEVDPTQEPSGPAGTMPTLGHGEPPSRKLGLGAPLGAIPPNVQRSTVPDARPLTRSAPLPPHSQHKPQAPLEGNAQLEPQLPRLGPVGSPPPSGPAHGSPDLPVAVQRNVRPSEESLSKPRGAEPPAPDESAATPRADGEPAAQPDVSAVTPPPGAEPTAPPAPSAVTLLAEPTAAPPPPMVALLADRPLRPVVAQRAVREAVERAVGTPAEPPTGPERAAPTPISSLQHGVSASPTGAARLSTPAVQRFDVPGLGGGPPRSWRPAAPTGLGSAGSALSEAASSAGGLPDLGQLVASGRRAGVPQLPLQTPTLPSAGAGTLPSAASSLLSGAASDAGTSPAQVADAIQHPGAAALATGVAERAADGSVVFPAATEMAGQATAPAAEATDQAAAAGTAGTAGAAGAAGDPDEMARQLYDRLRIRLKAELRLDRERAGLITDLPG